MKKSSVGIISIPVIYNLKISILINQTLLTDFNERRNSLDVSVSKH